MALAAKLEKTKIRRYLPDQNRGHSIKLFLSKEEVGLEATVVFSGCAKT